jgi:acyl-CoA thioesterase-1
MPADLITPSDPLPHVAAALAKGSVNILALGSGSTVGDSGGSGGPALAFHTPEGSFPYKMIETLQAARPDAHFQLTVEGGRNMAADEMLPILRQQLAAHHYDMVLWQTGTVEAVHGLRPDGLRGVLVQGAEAAETANVDLVLIDPQFSRFLRANVDLGPYVTVLQQMTGNPGVSLFHRLDLTRNWVGNGQIDVERVTRDQRDATIVLLNTCLGQALARYVLAGASGH